MRDYIQNRPPNLYSNSSRYLASKLAHLLPQLAIGTIIKKRPTAPLIECSWPISHVEI